MSRYRDSQLMEIAEDFRFTEEVYQLIDAFNERDDKPSNFDIHLLSTKDCSKGKEPEELLADTKICTGCYYRKILNKMSTIRKSKREAFIEYQVNLRQEKEKFLQEIEELIIDNESYFSSREYGMQSDYLTAIRKLKNPNKSSLGTITDWGQLLNLGENVKIVESNNQPEMLLDIFISHSSKDSEIAKCLIELLRSAFGIESKKIRCTSVDGYKLRGGVNTDQKLNEEIESSKLFIGLISKESISSTYVLFEMGARWGLKMPLKMMLFDNSVFSSLKPPLSNLHIINLSRDAEIHQLLDEVEEELDYNRDSVSSYLDKINQLKSEIEKRKNAV